VDRALEKCIQNHLYLQTHNDTMYNENITFLNGDVVMKQNSCLIEIAILSTILNFFFDQEASAYLDPGTGSYVLQMLIAGLLGALFFLKLLWKKIKAFLGNSFSKNNDEKRIEN